MRPTDLARRLNRLSELAGTEQKLRRVLENVDLIAQGAIDAEQTYVNKKGDAVTTEAPQWHVALAAQKLAGQLLGLGAADPDDKDKPDGKESPVKRILAAVPKQGAT